MENCTPRPISLIALAFTSAIPIGLCVALAWQKRRTTQKRVELLVRKAQKLAAEDIGPFVGDTDELSALDRAFHCTADLIAEQTKDLERYRLLVQRTQCLKGHVHCSRHG